MPPCSAFAPLPGIHGLSILRLQLRPTQMVIMIQGRPVVHEQYRHRACSRSSWGNTLLSGCEKTVNTKETTVMYLSILLITYRRVPR